MIGIPTLGIYGQLGNQIFQFSALVGVANKNNYEYFVPIESLQERGVCTDSKTNTNFRYALSLLECFDINCNLNSLSEFNNKITNTYNEPHHHFDSNIFNINDNTYITGYFETEKYFEHCPELIRGLLKFRPKIEKISAERIKNINKENKKLLSLHVRRGQDRPSVQDYHPFIDKEYYENCLKHFNSNEWKVIVFTDDFEWAKENIKFDDIHFHEWCVEYKRPDFIDLCMMTYCDSHIIANSTFSWWGAWLCKNRDNQKVFAPKTWFGPALNNKSTVDLIPERWNRIY